MKTTILTTILALLACTAAASAAGPPHFTLTPVAIPDVADVHPAALSDTGEVVGSAMDTAFCWKDGQATLLGKLPQMSFADGNVSRANAVNNHGQIVGGAGGFRPIFMSGLYDCVPFLYDPKDGIRPLPSDGGGNASYEAFGINDAGVVVGLDVFRGFYQSNGHQVEVKPLSHYPEYNGTRCTAVNQRGWFVGTTTIQQMARPARDYNNHVLHAFLCRGPYPAHHLIDLGSIPAHQDSFALGLNDQGDVVGLACDDGDDKHVLAGRDTVPILWRRGRMTALALPATADHGCANGINNRGWVVGNTTGRVHGQAQTAMLWIDGQPYNLNTLVASEIFFTDAVAINNHGQILCATGFRGRQSAWLLTPDYPATGPANKHAAAARATDARKS